MQLDEYLTLREESGAAFARRLDVSNSLVHCWRHRTKLPSLEMARRIKVATAGLVTPDDWLGELTPEEAASWAGKAGGDA